MKKAISALKDLRPRFDEGTEKAYKSWLDDNSRFLFRVALSFGSVAYLVNHLGDYAIPGADLDKLLQIRVWTAATLAAVLGVMFHFRDINPTSVAFSTAIVASAANSAIAHSLPGDAGFWLVAAQAIVAMFMTVIVSGIGNLLMVAIIMLLLPTTIHLAHGNGHVEHAIAEGNLLAVAIASMMFLGFFIDHIQRKIFKLSRELRYTATHDILTGVYNRFRVLEVLDHELKRIERLERPVAVLCIDIDHFKSINDTYGHPAGDQVLRALSKRIAGEIRGSDTFGRIGGEEFLVIMPETNLPAAQEMAERLRLIAEAAAVDWHGIPVRCTISIGVAQLRRGEDADSLILRADAALYRAKANGRNRVETDDVPVIVSSPQPRGLAQGSGRMPGPVHVGR